MFFGDQYPLINLLLLSLIASLGTGLGGLIAVLRRPGRRSYGFLMGLTAGVMLCLAFLELVNQAWELGGPWAATGGFAAGATLMFLLDYLAPHMRFGEVEAHGVHGSDRPCEDMPRRYGEGRHLGRRMRQTKGVDLKLVNSGLLLAVGITLHNLPEGIAVGAGYLTNPRFGLMIALAITLHNIPEGIATALPLCKGGVHRWDAFKVALLSGLAEPVGALVAYLFLAQFKFLIPAGLAFAGGVMVFITLDELLPSARENGSEHWTSAGIILGSLFVFLLSATLGL